MKTLYLSWDSGWINLFQSSCGHSKLLTNNSASHTSPLCIVFKVQIYMGKYTGNWEMNFIFIWASQSGTDFFPSSNTVFVSSFLLLLNSDLSHLSSNTSFINQVLRGYNCLFKFLFQFKPLKCSISYDYYWWFYWFLMNHVLSFPLWKRKNLSGVLDLH